MAHPIEFAGANGVLFGSPPDGNIQPLPVFRNGVSCTSCWVLSPEEVAEVVRTGRIFLTVVFGKTQPPVFVGGEQETREVISDYGVWKR